LGSKLVEGARWEAIAMAWLNCWKEFVKYDADDEVISTSVDFSHSLFSRVEMLKMRAPRIYNSIVLVKLTILVFTGNTILR
jgi:hypothetical protein